jgi:integrase
MRVKLTPAIIAKPPTPQGGSDRIFLWDTEQRGLGLMVTVNRHQSYVIQYRAGARSRRVSLKHHLTLQEARRQARKLLGDVAKGIDPVEEERKKVAAEAAERTRAANTFEAVANEYIRRSKKRSIGQTESVLRRAVFPEIGRLPVQDIRKGDVIRMLDRLEDERGPSAADIALAHVRTILNWHAERDDDFKPPLLHLKSRSEAEPRSRTLSDDEIRSVWKAAEASTSVMGPFVQFLLLTACRRNEAAQMAREELEGAVWVIPASRSKNKREHVLPLSDAAITALERLPKIANSRFVFTHDGAHAFANFSKSKAQFDKACGVTGWTLHDLRRSARSLMSRAGVDADVAERVLSHAIGGIRRVYDRHAYHREKADALERLAALIDRIVNPAENVIALRG